MSKEEKIIIDRITSEDLKLFLNYILTGKVSSVEEAESIKRMANTTVTLKDVAVLYKTLNHQIDKSITQLMEVYQIHRGVLARLGATKEMYEEAQEDYNKSVEEVEKYLQEELAEKNKKSKTEDEEDGEVHK